MTNNIIFLEIDEVLNSISSTIWNKQRKVSPFDFEGFNPISVALLRKLVELADAKIVLSSTWRLHYDTFEQCHNEFEAKFEKLYGWEEFPIIGMTPELNYCHGSRDTRGREIEHWLFNNEYKNFVIIDDSCEMMAHQLSNFVRIDYRNGFDFNNMLDCLEILEVNDEILRLNNR